MTYRINADVILKEAIDLTYRGWVWSVTLLTTSIIKHLYRLLYTSFVLFSLNSTEMPPSCKSLLHSMSRPPFLAWLGLHASLAPHSVATSQPSLATLSECLQTGPGALLTIISSANTGHQCYDTQVLLQFVQNQLNQWYQSHPCRPTPERPHDIPLA